MTRLSAVLASVALTWACGDSGTEPGPDPSRPVDANRAALVALYHATDGPNWRNSDNWLTDAPLAAWHGVETSSSGEVISLFLDYNALAGPIPPELGGLTALRNLFLSQNRLTGPIPPELGNLTRLELLSIEINELTGPIPQSLLAVDGLIAFFFDENADLCAPGTTDFVNWLQGIEGTGGPHCNESDAEVLTLLHQTSAGPNWTNSRRWLETPALDEWYGVTADSLGRVVTLDLTRNGLAGQLQADLGSLDLMTVLRVGGNALFGRLPLSLARLSLVELRYGDTGLCVPGEASFQAWLNGIASHEGTGMECAALSERETLAALYEATNGSNWTHSDNWLTDAPLGDWYGVGTDAQGQVTALDLPGNSLTGPIPPELGSLASLEWLHLNANDLTGAIPPELGNLSSLENLYLGDNALSGLMPAELGDLASLVRLDLGRNGLSGPIPAELAASLLELNLENNALTGAIPAELGSLASLVQLNLDGNLLSGAIPAELGGLARLERLHLGYNRLAGPIPAELGSLASLMQLNLEGNLLSGAIPAELGDLARLEQLNLGYNDLTGVIPAELGDVAALRHLDLRYNALSGPIPPGLGNLSGLARLYLWYNDLTGPIPPQLGNLASLRTLALGNNDLTGPVPPEFRGLSRLQQLNFTNNSGMAGALPDGLTDLNQLETLLAGGTDLCAPDDLGFRAWLQTIHNRRIASCAGPAMAYLTQAVQSLHYPVPLVAGDEALLRVFMTTAHVTPAGIPPVRAQFYLDGIERGVVNIPARTTSATVPTEIVENSLHTSANADIPREMVQPGLEMVIEIDPEGTVGVATRIPETGRMAVEVAEMPMFDLTVIPFLWSTDPDRTVVEAVGGMAADPEGHELLWETRTLLPVGDLDVTPHEPVLSSSNSIYALLNETAAIRALEGGTGHYMGMMSGPVGPAEGARGVAHLPGRASFSIPDSRIIAHELGHNLSLGHAPCDTFGPDPSFPYPDGSTGAWGYDFRNGGLVRPNHKDLMSYCEPGWISDYHFTNALRFRLLDESLPPVAALADEATSLLLWGGVDAEGEPFLNPAFVVDAPSALAGSAGEHRITGRSDRGEELFALSFDMPEVSEGDGSSSFAFVLPVLPIEAGNLASITLSGPYGSVTLDGESNRPMAILRNPRTGQIRGFLRDLAPATQAANDAVGQAAGTGLEVLFSRGIPR